MPLMKIDVLPNGEREFIYKGSKGTLFCWLENLSKVSITWSGNQLIELEASRKVRQDPVTKLFGLSSPNKFTVPVNNQELKVTFIPNDLLEWFFFLLENCKSSVNPNLNLDYLKDLLIRSSGSISKTFNVDLSENGNQKISEQPIRRKRREL